MKMKVLSYTLRFNTPAFLGNAEQNGQWRTPPFKAQLRQWWRVAYAATHGFPEDTSAMRHAEGELFGNAWLKDGDGHNGKSDFSKSRVRIRLSTWDEGSLRSWPDPDPMVDHPEVSSGRPVGSQLYLGYGPLVFKKGTALKANAAIQSGEAAILRMATPDQDAALVEAALRMMDRYGSVGGRSRNGWGSYSLESVEGTAPLTGDIPQRQWHEALGLDWPHALGLDEQGALVWQTPVHGDWVSLMKELAAIKIQLRRQFPFASGNTSRPEERHWLSYPVTHHEVHTWKQARLPNSLRFKVRPLPEGGLVGVIFHVPCSPPRDFHPDRETLVRVWSRVHSHLDETGLKRIPE